MEEKDTEKGIVSNLVNHYILDDLLGGADEKVDAFIDRLVEKGRLGAANAEDIKKFAAETIAKIKEMLNK